MLSSVLRSHRATLVNIAIMRAFVRIREVLSTHKDLAQKLEALFRRIALPRDKSCCAARSIPVLVSKVNTVNPGYSYRNATIGSTFVARRAGM